MGSEVAYSGRDQGWEILPINVSDGVVSPPPWQWEAIQVDLGRTVNVLFVCTRNRARSIAAERLFQRPPGLTVRSAGTSSLAARRVDAQDLAWAALLVVFELAHERWLRATFAGDLPTIIDAGIPDAFTLDDPALRAALHDSLKPLFGPPGLARLKVQRAKEKT